MTEQQVAERLDWLAEQNVDMLAELNGECVRKTHLFINMPNQTTAEMRCCFRCGAIREAGKSEFYSIASRIAS